jgi:hypothetical protein
MSTIETVVYQYDELSDSAKEKAREWYLKDGLDYDWWDFCYEDFVRVADILGIEFSTRRGSKRPEIYFTGFYCQGSASSFVGTYRYAKGTLAKIKKYAPQDEELHRIAKALQYVQSRHFYKLVARVESVRDHLIRVSVEDADYPYRDIGDAEGAINDLMNDFNDWMFKTLEREYEWLTSDEVVEENIRANEYEFDEYGRPA